MSTIGPKRSKETGICCLVGTLNTQIQMAINEALNSQVLPQVRNVLRDVQNRDKFGPDSLERPHSGLKCLDLDKQRQNPEVVSNMTLDVGENATQNHYTWHLKKLKLGPLGDQKS